MKKKIIIIIFSLGILLIIGGFTFYYANTYLSVEKNNNSNKHTTYTGNIGEVKMSDDSPDENNYKVNKNGTLSNTSKGVAKKHSNGDFVVENMTITLPTNDEYMADYTYVIKNNGTINYESIDVSIIFIFADGTRLISSPVTIKDLNASGEQKVERKDYMSIVGAVDYDIEIKK